MKHVVIVGASLAGVRAAEALRREGFDGRLTIIGAESYFPPYDRPPFSKQLLAGSCDAEATRLAVRPDLGAEVLLGETATALDVERRIVELASGGTIAFDGLVVATGARPRTLPTEPSGLSGVFTLRTLEDCAQLRHELLQGPRVVVIGAGFVGSEVAATARSLGLDVTVVDVLDVPLRDSCGLLVGRYVEGLHRDRGVRLRLGRRVTRIAGHDRVSAVHLDDGSRLDADVVVVGVGVRPATEWLIGSGLQLRDGLVCDEYCVAVGTECVVGAGDVARWWNPFFEESMRVEHWTNAVEQGAAAARALTRGPEPGREFAPIPYVWSDLYDSKVQIAGVPRGRAELVEGSAEEGRFVGVYGCDGRIVGAVCVNSPARLGRYRRLIAARAEFCPASPERPRLRIGEMAKG